MQKPFEKKDGTYLEEATEDTTYPEEATEEEEYPEEDPENVEKDPWYDNVFAPLLEKERRHYYGRS